MTDQTQVSPNHPMRRSELVSAWQAAQKAVFTAEDALNAACSIRDKAMEQCAAEGYQPWGDELVSRSMTSPTDAPVPSDLEWKPCCPFCGSQPKLRFRSAYHENAMYSLACIMPLCPVMPETAWSATPEIAGKRWESREPTAAESRLAALEAENARLREGLSGALGLIELVRGRDDLPGALAASLSDHNWRVARARAALSGDEQRAEDGR